MQGVRSIGMSHISEHLLQNVADEIIRFVKESKNLVSKFTTAGLQAFNRRKQHSRSFYFRLLWYSAIFSPHGKEIDTEIDTFRLKQMKETFQKLYRTKETDDEDLS